MMMSLEDVFEFYSKGSSYWASSEPSNLTWKEILECLQHSDAGDFAYATIGSDKKTLLNCHFKNNNITGEDNDEIAVARMLIERSIDMGGSTVQLGEMQEHGDSVLTVSDHHGRTPLHDLFERSPIPHSHIRYVELIIEMSASGRSLRPSLLDFQSSFTHLDMIIARIPCSSARLIARKATSSISSS
jgi:hypothetical protein